MHQLSVCIYEFPAATYDIQHWKTRFKDKIAYIADAAELTGDPNVYYFQMKGRKVNGGYVGETVYCIPHYRLHDVMLRDPIVEIFDASITINSVFKLILVGSFDTSMLHKILVLTDQLKSMGMRDLKDEQKRD